MPDSYQACNSTVTNTFCLVAKQIIENNREDLISRYFLTRFDTTSIPVNPTKSLLHLAFIPSFYKSRNDDPYMYKRSDNRFDRDIQKFADIFPSRLFIAIFVHRNLICFLLFFLFYLTRIKLVYQSIINLSQMINRFKMIAKIISFYGANYRTIKFALFTILFSFCIDNYFM